MKPCEFCGKRHAMAPQHWCPPAAAVHQVRRACVTDKALKVAIRQLRDELASRQLQRSVKRYREKMAENDLDSAGLTPQDMIGGEN